MKTSLANGCSAAEGSKYKPSSMGEETGLTEDEDQCVRNVWNIIVHASGPKSSNGAFYAQVVRGRADELRRGPAKGYIEVLENRLHETETVLLGVLSQISDTQLASTFARDESNSGYTPFPPEKRGAEYWRRFPLDTASSVREWQQDCMPDRQQEQQQPSQGLEVEPPSPPRQLISHTNPSAASSPETRSPSQRAHRQRTSQEPSSWTGAPPARFQERFLW